MTSGVLRDLSSKHEPQWAVALHGELLPVRFATEAEAALHLYGLNTGHVVASPHLPAGTAPGQSLRSAA